MKTTKDNRRTAIHEAGHAAVAIWLGHEAPSISILAGKGYLGICRSADLKPYLDELSNPNPFENPEAFQRHSEIEDRREQRWKEEIIALQAGEVAEEIHLGNVHQEGVASDRDKALSYCWKLAAPHEIENLVSEQFERCRAILSTDTMQRVVIALAIALETHKELDGDAVNEIYNQALLEPTP